ncbi:hypothetical protein OIE67_17795 [Nonomuraea fuscirosea]|uniref:hypothetical protein n=1 Tax=Nonomuraea fuscirosea TaxID=1291556 RepID=UPI002DD960B1|nr:hypothetical protein [Nonomuraea fuscirosea]WSA56389.1 hypothetical protein OIE67_17795 [Nonomuraea fuscirosea]
MLNPFPSPASNNTVLATVADAFDEHSISTLPFPDVDAVWVQGRSARRYERAEFVEQFDLEAPWLWPPGL